MTFPDIEGLRPTPDRVRETLFNWLQLDIAGSRCLDLFAGSGALGVEALSRGANEVVFIEKSALAARSIRAHLDLLGGNGVVIESDVERHLGGTPGGGESGSATPDAGVPHAFDLVFLDPPFGQHWLPRILPRLAARNV